MGFDNVHFSFFLVLFTDGNIGGLDCTKYGSRGWPNRRRARLWRGDRSCCRPNARTRGSGRGRTASRIVTAAVMEAVTAEAQHVRIDDV